MPRTNVSMNRRSALTFTVLLLVASAAAALPAVTASSTPTSTTGGGNNTSSAPMLTITTDKSSYSPGDTIMVNASVSGLTINNTYTIDAWISGFSQNYSRNWTAYQNSSSEQFNFTAVNSSGYKVAYVKLWTSSSSWVQKNTYISISSSSTGGNSSSGGNQTGGNSSSGGNSSTGGSNTSSAPMLTITTDKSSYSPGDTIMVNASVSGLTINNTYTIDAWISGFSQNYSRNWTAYQNSSSEQFNFTAVNSSGYKYVVVKLWTSSSSWVQKNTWISISSSSTGGNSSNTTSPSVSVSANRSWYYTGDQVSIKMDSSNLKLNDSYTLSWTFDNNTYSRNWTATSSSNTEWWNFTANKAGSFYLNVTLSNGSSTWNSYRYIWIYTRSLSVQITTDKSAYAVGDTIQVNVSVSYLTLNSNYSMKAWMGSQTDYRNWTAYQNTSSEQFNFTAIASTSMMSQFVYVRITSSSTGGTSSNTYYSNLFTVTSPSVSVNSTYYYYTIGDQVSIFLNSSNLDVNESYTLNWTFDNNTYSRNWTGVSAAFEWWNFTANKAGNFYLNVTLSNGSGVAVSYTGAYVSIYRKSMSLPVTITTDRSNYTEGDTINVNVSVSNLTLNTAYTMEAWSGSVKYYRNWTAYQNSSTEQFNFTATMPSWVSSSGYSQWMYVRISTVNSTTSTHYKSVSVSSSNSTTTPVPTVSISNVASSYTVNSTVRAWIDSTNLTNNTNYSISWTLKDGGTMGFWLVDSGYRNWTAHRSWNYELVNMTVLVTGWYCINADLYQIHNNGSSSWLGWDNACFSVTNASTGGGNTTTPVPWVQANTSSTSYTNGSTVRAWIGSYNLTNGTNYSLEWDLAKDHMAVFTSVDSGWFNWTAYGSYSYTGGLNWTGLGVGWYCLDVELYQIHSNGSSSWPPATATSCFSVTASNNTTVSDPVPWVQANTSSTSYTNGSTAWAWVDSHNLTIGTNYSLEWTLYMDGTFVDYGWFNWTAYYNSSYESLNWSGLMSGYYYCLDVSLYRIDNNSPMPYWFDSDWSCFSVTASNDTTPAGPSVVAGTDWTNYTKGDVVRATIDSHDLVIGTNYSVTWVLCSNIPCSWWNSESNFSARLEIRDDSGDNMVNWTAWQNSSKEHSNWTGLDAGWYCFVVDLYHVADDYRATLLDSDVACFDVSNGTQTNDFDGDGLDDAVDDDDDNDFVNDVMDAFPLDPNEWADLDGDGIGDNADPDDDGDGANDSVDAFPYNGSEQADSDGDGMGDNIDQCDDTPSGTPILSNGCHSPVVTSTPDNISVNATLEPLDAVPTVPSAFGLSISVSNPDGWEGAQVNWHISAPAADGGSMMLIDVGGHLLVQSTGALLDEYFELSEIHTGSLCIYWELYSSNQSSIQPIDANGYCIPITGEDNTTSAPANLPPTCAIYAPLISAGIVTTDVPVVPDLVAGTIMTVPMPRGSYYAIASCSDPDGDVLNVTVNGLSYEGTDVLGYALITIDDMTTVVQVSVSVSDGVNTLAGMFNIQYLPDNATVAGGGNATGSSDAAGETGAGGFVPAAGLLPTLIMGLAAALLASRRRKDEAMTVNHPERR